MTDAQEAFEEVRLAQAAAEGQLQLLQLLVMSLVQTGQLDPTDYAARIAAWSAERALPGSVEESQMWRMLSVLVGDPDALLRRAAFRVVPGAGGRQTAPAFQRGGAT